MSWHFPLCFPLCGTSEATQFLPFLRPVVQPYLAFLSYLFLGLSWLDPVFVRCNQRSPTDRSTSTSLPLPMCSHPASDHPTLERAGLWLFLILLHHSHLSGTNVELALCWHERHIPYPWRGPSESLNWIFMRDHRSLCYAENKCPSRSLSPFLLRGPVEDSVSIKGLFCAWHDPEMGRRHSTFF